MTGLIIALFMLKLTSDITARLVSAATNDRDRDRDCDATTYQQGNHEFPKVS